MTYHINDQSISLADLRRRIESTDLVPSRDTLKQGINEHFANLVRLGITNLKELRFELKSNPKLKNLANKSDIEEDYLVLLRREIEGYFPRPFPLEEFDFPSEVLSILNEIGIKDSAQFFEATNGEEKKNKLVDDTKLDSGLIHVLACLCNLTRVQWTSPTAARMLFECGVLGSEELAATDAEGLYESLTRVNLGNKYFKGKIGLRDVKRLVQAAGYVC
jgi:hypothetical protein